MLVLSRERDQRIFIGDDVIITIVDVRGDRVRIGIDAPRNVAILREEVPHSTPSAVDQGPAIQPTEDTTARINGPEGLYTSKPNQ